MAKATGKSAKASEYLVSQSQVNAEGIHVWPFKADFPVDVVHHRLSGHQPFRMNRHDYFELVYLKSGELVWQVQDTCITGKKGDLFVMTGPKYHRVTERSSSDVVVESLFFQPQLVQSASLCCDIVHPVLELSQNTSFEHIISSESKLPIEVLQLMEQIRQSLPAKTEIARLAIKTYVKMILVLLLSYYPSSQKRAVFDQRQSALDRFKPLFDILERDYQFPISPADGASAVNMSPSNFRRAFKQLTGQSFVAYLNHFRVAKAQELLTNSNIPIAQVGLEVGFCDQSYFGLVFRRLTQTTPRQYRENVGSVQPGKAKAATVTPPFFGSPAFDGNPRLECDSRIL